MPFAEDYMKEVFPMMNGINILVEALNDRLKSLPGTTLTLLFTRK